MFTSPETKGISELTLTELLSLPYENVLQRVRSGEWDLEQFTQWAEDRANYAFGDGYDEGYTTGEEEERVKKLENKSFYAIMNA
jgi:hypothetical protein